MRCASCHRPTCPGSREAASSRSPDMSELGWKYLTDGDKAEIVSGIHDGAPCGGPYPVEIYPADRCNIDCFFCSTAAIRGTDELPLSRLEEMIGELKDIGTRSVRLAG